MVNHSGNFEIDIDVEAFVGDEPTNVGHVGKESLVFGPDWPIGYRITAEEYLDGGLTIDHSTKFCQAAVKAGVDWIDNGEE